MSEVDKIDLNRDNFIKYYLENQSKSNDDVFQEAQVVRVGSLMKYAANKTLLGSPTSEYDLEQDLDYYANLIDDVKPNAISNFTDVIQKVFPNTKDTSNAQQWTSALKIQDFESELTQMKTENVDEKEYKEMRMVLKENFKRADHPYNLNNPTTSFISQYSRSTSNGGGVQYKQSKLAFSGAGSSNTFMNYNQSKYPEEISKQVSNALDNKSDKSSVNRNSFFRSKNITYGQENTVQNNCDNLNERNYNENQNKSTSTATPALRNNFNENVRKNGFFNRNNGQERNYNIQNRSTENKNPNNPFQDKSLETNPYFQNNPGNSHEIRNPYGIKTDSRNIGNGFRSAKEELQIQNAKKFGRGIGQSSGSSGFNPGMSVKRSLGARKSSGHGKFVPPNLDSDKQQYDEYDKCSPEEEIDERLRNIDPKMVELIRSEIMDSGSPITWDDIAGLEFAKTTIQEIVVWPMLRPDIFTGLRRPPKGILLFGPPGTGKTLIGKCIASQSHSTFFSISASSLTSKWIGDGEKMVRALFAVARVHQPAVIFIDEIDSLLTQRSDTEHESSRRIKTEFLVQLDGATTGDEDRILVIGATNRPQELDEAARRRLVKRLYIPLPDSQARYQIVQRLMHKERNQLTDEEMKHIAQQTEGYSGADMKNLCAEASLGPIRSIDIRLMQNIGADEVRPINLEDFQSAINRVRASVSSKDLDQYVQWDKVYGSGTAR